VSSVTGAVVAV